MIASEVRIVWSTSKLVDRLLRLFPTPDLFDDRVEICGPRERFRIVVGFGEVLVDGGLEIDNALEDAAFEPLSGQFGEEALDGVEPGRRGRGEMEIEPGCRSSQARTLGCLCVA